MKTAEFRPVLPTFAMVFALPHVHPKKRFSPGFPNVCLWSRGVVLISWGVPCGHHKRGFHLRKPHPHPPSAMLLMRNLVRGGTSSTSFSPLAAREGAFLAPSAHFSRGVLEKYKSPKGTNSYEAADKKVKQLRGALVAVERAMGVPLGEIAKKYHISHETAKRYLDTAQEAGFIEHFRALIYERLVGKAMAVYEAKLEMGDLEAARDIAFGLGVLSKNPGKGGSDPKPIDTLAAYRAERMKTIVDVQPAEDTNAKKL